ncbi:fibronectin type III domain-containing protein [Shewanella violacea]|uniref:Fibronectin type-III domain-containing protein n=1 Tax=Shewanella violacea (strain JCM 10179 / CIP 106290 / LMG 19151 / DSS12) TaxID=637905 RepID=D4ZLI3_SHEVD|nr:hypothetical protein [Shewanella violacea]BAJ02532.1 hypothetical protein SVI_2561 [Shewanella violacea DSS12]
MLPKFTLTYNPHSRPFWQACLLMLLLMINIPFAQAQTCIAMSQPTGVSLNNNAGTAVTLSWSAVYGATGYQLQTYLDNRYQSVSSTSSSATFTGLSAGVYYFNVTAINSCNEQSAPSEWFAVNMDGIAQCTAPETPSGLVASSMTGTGFTASWNTVTNAEHYQVTRWDDNSGWVEAASSTSTAHQFTQVATGTEYLRVNASNQCGQSADSSYITVEITGASTCPVSLSAPQSLQASQIHSTGFTLSWAEVDKADQYQVQLWLNGAWSSLATTSALTYPLSGLASLSEQYVRILAQLDCDQSVVGESDWISVTLSQTACPTQLDKATSLVTTNLHQNGFELNWNSVPNADSYSVQLWVSGQWSTLDTTTSTSMTLDGLNANSSQYVRVVAHTDCDNSIISESEWLEVILTAQCPEQLIVPTNLALSRVSDSSFQAVWSAVPSATHYQLKLATNGTWQTSGTQASNAKLFSQLDPGSYQVKVAAMCGNVTSGDSAPKTITIESLDTCNLADINGGIDISRYGDSFDDFSFSGNIYVQGARFNPSQYTMKITCQGKYGFVSSAVDHNADNYAPFTYSYSHFGQRSSNVETVQFEITSGGYTSRQTLSWNLNVGTLQNPVQPYCSNINIDNDNDGIPDCAEQPGMSFFGMPVYDWGARTGQTDLFIEVDYMSKASSGDHGTQPRREVFDKLKSVFADHGYSLHFDLGGLFGSGPQNYNLGGGQAVQYSPWIGLSDWRNEYDGNYAVPGMKNNDTYPGVFSYMPVYFDNRPERARLFYYALFASSQAAGGEGSSGQAPDYFDYYFYVALGSPSQASKSRWFLNDTSGTELNRMINSQASVFMHEFGHILGLSHGGWPDTYPNYEPNFKPNYLSVMNYAYALSGVPYTGNGLNEKEMISDRHYAGVRRDKNAACLAQLETKYGSDVSRRNFPGGLETQWQSYNLDYSYGNHASFNEAGFNEAYVEGGIDLTCDGLVSNQTSSFNINYDYYAPDYVSARYDTMRDYNDWDNIHLYYKQLNYSKEGQFLISGNTAAKHAIEPADVIPGAIASPKTLASPSSSKQYSPLIPSSRPIGVEETLMPWIE